MMRIMSQMCEHNCAAHCHPMHHHCGGKAYSHAELRTTPALDRRRTPPTCCETTPDEIAHNDQRVKAEGEKQPVERATLEKPRPDRHLPRDSPAERDVAADFRYMACTSATKRAERRIRRRTVTRKL